MVVLFRRAAIAAFVIMVAVPAAGWAQGFRISPAVGLYTPVSDLGTIQGPSGLVEFGKRESTTAWALNLDFGRSDRMVGFRIGLLWAGRSDVPIDGVGCSDCTLRSTLAAATAGLVIQPFAGIPLLRPYAVVGAGAKLYDFDPDTFTAGLVKNKALFLGQVGVGVRLFPDAGFGLFAELSDYVNGFDFADGSGDLQHDLVLMVGLTLGG